jgi:hypothetical protein
MVRLDGSAAPVTIEPGYVITAPGLVGEATSQDGREPLTRGGGVEQATDAFDEALAATDLREARTIVLDVDQQPAAGPTTMRTRSSGEDALLLETPDLGPDRGQVVLAIDEEGVITWNLPEPEPEPAGPARRGGGGTRFLIRKHTPPVAPGVSERRGLTRTLGRKLLKVLVYPITDPVLGAVGAAFARRWEARNRPYGLRAFTPDDYRVPAEHGLDEAGLRRLGDGRALLFVHGTFSTSHGGFGGLPGETLAALHRAYDGRVAAFDHHTLSDDVQVNVDRLLDMLPSGLELDLDVVTHSRGGLVARGLAGELGTVDGVHVRRLVFGATPNRGTVLTDAEHMTSFLDRMTSLLQLLPPGPPSVVSSVLEAIITAVKVFGRAGLQGLDGLVAMHPAGALIGRLNAPGDGAAEATFAIAADYEPSGSLRTMLTAGAVNAVVDRVFGEPNDIVVPTEGVYSGGGPGFPVEEAARVHFDGERSVWHSSIYSQPETSEALLRWLGGDGGR